jgi:hypothetical protein
MSGSPPHHIGDFLITDVAVEEDASEYFQPETSHSTKPKVEEEEPPPAKERRPVDMRLGSELLIHYGQV